MCIKWNYVVKSRGTDSDMNLSDSAHTQHEFFEEILTMIVEILHKQQEDG